MLERIAAGAVALAICRFLWAGATADMITTYRRLERGAAELNRRRARILYGIVGGIRRGAAISNSSVR